MKTGKKILIIALSIVCICLHVQGCCHVIISALPDFGARDWRYPICHGYQIDEMHYGYYLLTNDSWEEFTDGVHISGIVVDANVISFCYNESYIGLQCIQEYDIKQNEIREDVDYYLIDMEADSKYGPFTEDEYYQFCESKEIPPFDNWINTIPRPDGATYY